MNWRKWLVGQIDRLSYLLLLAAVTLDARWELGRFDRELLERHSKAGSFNGDE